MLLVEILVETYNKKIKNYCNSGDKKQKRARARAITGDMTLKPIQDSIKDETDKKDDRNISNHGASYSNSDSRRLKFISFLSLIREVILNDLRFKKEYCH